MSSARDDILVQKQCWEQPYFWAKLTPPIRRDGRVAFDQSMRRALTETIKANWSVAGAMLVAPGHARWLARYAWEVAALSLASSLVLTWQLGLDGVVLGTTIPMLLMSPLFLSKILSTLPVTVTSLIRIVLDAGLHNRHGTRRHIVAVRLSVRIDTVLELMAVLATGPVIYWGIFYSVWTTPGERALCRDLIRGAARRLTSPGHRPT